MIRYTFCLILLIICFSDSIYSYDSKIWDTWYFGRRAGLTFNTPDRNPLPLSNGQLHTLEGCASISDTNGNILFYSDGVNVYNKLGRVMPNGTGLLGNESSTQSALIVKMPRSNSIYYIFTVDKGPYPFGEKTTHSFAFSIVDLTRDGGLGDVTVKNNVLHTPVIEKLSAVQHSNGEDFWIFARGMNDNKFIISLLTSGGISQTNTYEVGPLYIASDSPELSLGQLKANTKGDLLATVVYGKNNVELYKFDNLTGFITDYIGIPVDEDFTYLYAVEFSPNNKFLYINNLFGRIYQYDVSEFSAEKIHKSMKLVYDSLNYSFQEFGQLQLAPNGKIYMALNSDTALSIIHKPNVPAPYCKFDKKGQGLSGRLSAFGLPNNIVTGVYYSLDVYGRDICIGNGDSLEMFSIVYPEIGGYIYEWTGPNGFKSNEPNPKIYNAEIKHSGKYICRVTMNGVFFKSDSVFLNVYDYPIAEITGPSTICPPEIIKLGSKYQSPEFIYEWSTGSTESEILITSPGVYYLIVSNPAGCVETVFTEIFNDDDLSVVFEDNNKLCKGTNLRISLDKNIYIPLSDFKIRWSTGDTTLYIDVDKPGYYSATVLRHGGCSGIDSILVEEFERPIVKLNLSDSINICSGNTLILEPSEINEKWSYFWSDNFVELSREITSSGLYKMYVTNEGNCIDSASVYINVSENPDIDIRASGPLQFCYGDSVLLSASNLNEEYKYLWSTGDTTASILVKQSGIYKLTVSNSYDCMDSASIEVEVADELNLTINADKKFLCLGDSVTLTSNARYDKYLWSTGDTNDFIRVYQPGKYSLIVNNYLGCSDSFEIEIDEVQISSEFDKTEFLFDSICVGDNVSDIINIIYKSDENVVFDDYEYIGDDFNFELLQNIDEIASGIYEHKIELKVGKNKPGIYEGNIIISILEPCFSQFTIPVYLRINSEFTMSANHIEAQAGDSICLKIDVTSDCGDNGEYLYSPELEIKLHSEYFFPDRINGGTILSNIRNGNERTIRLKFDEQTFPLNSKRSLIICGIALSGQKSATNIDIENADFGNEQIIVSYISGTLSIEACSQDLRVLQIFKPINVSINPNPSDTFAEIIINSQERGKHYIEIYSVDGKILKRFELDDFDINNSQTIRLITSEFNQGLYNIIIKSPWNILNKQLLIIKN